MGRIFVNNVDIEKIYNYLPGTNNTTSLYTKGFIVGTTTSTTNVIFNTGADMFTIYTARESTNHTDISSTTGKIPLPIYTGTSQFNAIDPNKIVRSFRRYDVVQGGGDFSTIAKVNSNNSSAQAAVITFYGPGGAGAGSNPWVLGNYKSGGSGGGSGAYATVYTSNLGLITGWTGDPGIFGPVGADGYDATSTKLYPTGSPTLYVEAGGGKGGKQGLNQSQGANSGGLGGIFTQISGSQTNFLLLTSGNGVSGGASNSSGSSITQPADPTQSFFGNVYWSAYNNQQFLTYAGFLSSSRSGGDHSKTGDNNLGRGGGGGASLILNLPGPSRTGGDQIFGSADTTNYYRTTSIDVNLACGPSVGGGGGGASSRANANDRQDGGRGGRGFIQILF
jgi:hypothetical protein